MKPIEKFLSQNTPISSSKLAVAENDILDLLESGYAHKQIQQYLLEYKKINVTLGYLYRYIKNLKAKNNTTKSEIKDEEKTPSLSTGLFDGFFEKNNFL